MLEQRIPLGTWHRLRFSANGLRSTSGTGFEATDDADVVVYSLLPGGMQQGGYDEHGCQEAWG